jgi:cold-inducible RNA-binding protein
MNIYVGNLSRDVVESDLQAAFENFGQVTSATVIKDKFTGESRGFGFVEMPNSDEAETAINEMNGKDLKGRTLTVNQARPKPEGGDRRRPGGNGGRGGFGGRSGGPRGGNGGGFGGRGRF